MNFLAWKVAGNLIFLIFFPVLLTTNAANLTAQEKLILTAMKKDNLASVFGEEALEKAPIFNEALQEYEGEFAGKIYRAEFLLVMSGNTSVGVPIYIGDEELLKKACFNWSAPTKVIVHGFMSNFRVGPALELVPAYIEFGGEKANIILVDWSWMAGAHKAVINGTREWYNVFYFPPARNTEVVGIETGSLVEFLVNSGAKLEDFHLIGHSLGAHVMGWAGKYLEYKFGRKVRRITALDPAGPCFETPSWVCFFGYYRHVRRDDAEFVDVIHTHARALGMKAPVGHADFYPNGGFTQPGCRWYTFGQCSHRRAVHYMAQSIEYSNFSFLAQQCTSWDEYTKGDCHSTDFALFGEHCSARSRGIYFLSTLKKSNLERLIA